jgi:hypothetical protein
METVVMAEPTTSAHYWAVLVRLQPKLKPTLAIRVFALPHRSITMSNPEPTIAELFEDGHAIDEALREAARDARRFHKAIGNPMATWLDGRVVWVQAGKFINRVRG